MAWNRWNLCFLPCVCICVCVAPVHTCEMQTQAQMQTQENENFSISCVGACVCVCICVRVVHTCISLRLHLHLRLHLRRTCEPGLSQVNTALFPPKRFHPQTNSTCLGSRHHPSSIVVFLQHRFFWSQTTLVIAADANHDFLEKKFVFQFTKCLYTTFLHCNNLLTRRNRINNNLLLFYCHFYFFKDLFLYEVARRNRPHNLYRCEIFENLFYYINWSVL